MFPLTSDIPKCRIGNKIILSMGPYLDSPLTQGSEIAYKC